MGRARVKLEVTLDDGSRITFIVNNSNYEKIQSFLHFLKSMDVREESGDERIGDNTIYDRMYELIRDEFGRGMFSLDDVYKAYFLKYGEYIKKSTLSTYLTRLVNNGYLERTGSRGKYMYRYKGPISVGTPKGKLE